jgi:hypothetical protein
MTSSLFDHIENGPDWLDHPDLVDFLHCHELRDVKVQLVGPRRSFAGKAWPGSGVVRMVSVGVHPVRWLLTFMHELAHVADFRQRVRDLEKVWGRGYVPGRRDHRLVWQVERPHGERWRREFVRLVEDAVARGLFLGNEEVARATAEAGSTTLDGILLDLTADPRVKAEKLRVLEEQRRERIVQAAQGMDEFKRVFKAGVAVHFDGGPRQGVLSGTLVRINRKSCTVAAQGANWHVPHGFLQQGPAPEGARPARRALTARDKFGVGDEVYFRSGALRFDGKVIRVNRKTCTVRTAEGDWRVGFGMLKVAKK